MVDLTLGRKQGMQATNLKAKENIHCSKFLLEGACTHGPHTRMGPFA